MCLLISLAVVVTGVSAFGQAPAPAAAATPPPPPPPWSVGAIDFSGLIDGYYDYNFNHPVSMTNGPGTLNFDNKANQFSLNMVKLSMSHAVDPIGFQIDLGFGHAFDIINETTSTTGGIGVKNVEQAFISYKPNKDKSLQFDFGKFVTSAGAEVIESNGNWNYSRSDLFALAIPYYHFGLRVSGTAGHFTGGFQVVNGWNNVEDNNTGKTLGFVGNFTSKKLSWMNNFYTGPENTGTNNGWRNLYDTTVLLTPADKFNAYVNFDYGNQKSQFSGGPSQTWYGIAGAAKFQFTDKVALTPRFEYFNDNDRFAGFGADLKEFTITYEYKWAKGLMSRIEYRHDWANQAVFEKGRSSLPLGGPPTDHQDLLEIAFIAFFGPH
jgi:hypothetical protein